MEWCRRAALDRAHQRDQCSPRASISLSAVEPWEMRCVTCARIAVNVDVANILLRSDKAVVQQLGSTMKRETTNSGCRVLLSIPERLVPAHLSSVGAPSNRSVAI